MFLHEIMKGADPSHLAFTGEVRKHFAEHPDHFDPRQYLTDARTALRDMVRHKLVDVLGCNGKA